MTELLKDLRLGGCSTNPRSQHADVEAELFSLDERMASQVGAVRRGGGGGGVEVVWQAGREPEAQQWEGRVVLWRGGEGCVAGRDVGQGSAVWGEGWVAGIEGS